VVRETQEGGGGTPEKRVDFSYNALGQDVTIDRYFAIVAPPSSIHSEYTYDGLNRLTALVHTFIHGSLTRTIASYSRVYNAASEVTTATDAEGTTQYLYDYQGQLIRAKLMSRASAEEFEYDQNGNQTFGTRIGSGNRLLSDGYGYHYDGEGNLIEQDGGGVIRTFEWDNRNRLVRVTDRVGDTVTQVVQYTYDALDRRTSKTVVHSPRQENPSPTYFVYDRDNVLLELQVQVQFGPPVVTVHYLHGPGVDQVLAQDDLLRSNGLLWLLPDILGSTRDAVNGVGQVKNHIVYDAFGQVLSQTNLGYSSRYLFTGREYDAETGLYYYRSRYYDPRTGRFISEDRIRFDAGDPNLYRYVKNKPSYLKDPSGKNEAFTDLVLFFLSLFDAKARQDACVNDYKDNHADYLTAKYGPEGDFVDESGKQQSWDSLLRKDECRLSAELFLVAALAVLAAGSWYQDCMRRRKRLVSYHNATNSTDDCPDRPRE
jgi:RHS repeat-associated protein